MILAGACETLIKEKKTLNLKSCDTIPQNTTRKKLNFFGKNLIKKLENVELKQ